MITTLAILHLCLVGRLNESKDFDLARYVLEPVEAMLLNLESLAEAASGDVAHQDVSAHSRSTDPCGQVGHGP